jgi:p-aminobenzoyl-glutamate transporter AbgT
MELAIFGLVLLSALVLMCWKNFVAGLVAVVALMLGITIANSGGLLEQPSQDFTNGTRTTIGKLGDALFNRGGGR